MSRGWKPTGTASPSRLRVDTDRHAQRVVDCPPRQRRGRLKTARQPSARAPCRSRADPDRRRPEPATHRAAAAKRVIVPAASPPGTDARRQHAAALLKLFTGWARGRKLAGPSGHRLVLPGPARAAHLDPRGSLPGARTAIPPIALAGEAAADHPGKPRVGAFSAGATTKWWKAPPEGSAGDEPDFDSTRPSGRPRSQALGAVIAGTRPPRDRDPARSRGRMNAVRRSSGAPSTPGHRLPRSKRRGERWSRPISVFHENPDPASWPR